MTVTFDRDRVADSAEVLRLERVNLSTPDPVDPARGWSTAAEAMADVLRDDPVDIAGVVARLHTIQKIMEKLPPTPALNRIAAFNSLYLTITRQVEHALHGPGVTEPAFLETLDVEFAKRYLHALRLWGADDDSTPHAWEVLFRRGQDQRLTRLTAAMLGVNAHINFDLAMALIATWDRLGPPGDHIHPDYLLINKIFYQEIPGLRRRYSTPWQLDIDAICGNLDDWGQRVLVLGTRAMAWEQAERIWPLRSDPKDLERAEALMDRATAFLGESLIIGDGVVAGVGTELGRIWRLVKRLVGLTVRLGRARL